MSELIITKENYDAEVLRSDKPVLLDFYADWCGPCKMLAPILHKIAEEHADTLKVCKINVDNESELAEEFRIVSIPTLVVMKNGEIAGQSIGYCSEEEILALLK